MTTKCNIFEMHESVWSKNAMKPQKRTHQSTFCIQFVCDLVLLLKWQRFRIGPKNDHYVEVYRILIFRTK